MAVGNDNSGKVMAFAIHRYRPAIFSLFACRHYLFDTGIKANQRI